MIASDMSRTETRWFALLLGAAALLYFYGLGSTGLWAPDEPRFAAVAEELRRMDHGAQSQSRGPRRALRDGVVGAERQLVPDWLRHPLWAVRGDAKPE